ncbi:hypothetical protein BIW11_09464 [Tropilaelaps mercedesae]|uniref:Uncharacterized protein n=1 Tax=Tropilaelaps mercedesae TaxID=418985 RepID=A0A1V9XJZ7_9ACAR|nr:hypothetical protein BIW11_09464 [Tropilaelaps mercedesae]
MFDDTKIVFLLLLVPSLLATCSCLYSSSLGDHAEWRGYTFATQLVDFFAEMLSVSPEEIEAFLRLVPFNTTRKFVSTAVRDFGVRLLHLSDRVHQLNEGHVRLAIANFDSD